MLLHDLFRILIIVNTILAFYVVFHRRRSVATSWAWLIILLILPVIGFILYSFLGRGLSQENLFAINRQHHIGLRNVQKMIAKDQACSGPADTSGQGKVLVDFLNRNNESPLSKDNQIQLYTDGHDKFHDLLIDMEQAKSSINVEYYTFYNDQIGNQVLQLLIKKQKQGVKVRVLYDAWGSMGATKSWFSQLTKVGGQVLPFVTSRNMITRYRINYHLHRKIVVIDGRIGWTGGFNIGDQYLGRKEKFGYWRDDHVRIVGSAALILQERFVMDWNASIKKEQQLITFSPKLFPEPHSRGKVPIQIVADGPDRDQPYLRNGMMRLMLLSRKRLWIQTPYLIPDEAMIAAWQIIVNSGVDVRIMIPCKPDHPFIYRATQWYANNLAQIGVKIYIYDKGFLHAKSMIVDDKYAVVGSMNQDFRSYDLNFEDNAVIYDQDFTMIMAQKFLADLKDTHLLSISEIEAQGRLMHTLQSFSRLLSPIL